MAEFKSRTYANPRRLPRRNHCQEGPDFLFVATQGGRPPERAVGAGRAAIVRRRRAALRRWADDEPLGAICTESRCSRASLFRWRTRYEQGGLAALVNRPRIGRASDLPPVIERLILTVRLLTYWNSSRIAAEFRRRGVWPLGHRQVDRILDRNGSHRPSYIRTPGRAMSGPPWTSLGQILLQLHDRRRAALRGAGTDHTSRVRAVPGPRRRGKGSSGITLIDAIVRYRPKEQ